MTDKKYGLHWCEECGGKITPIPYWWRWYWLLPPGAAFYCPRCFTLYKATIVTSSTTNWAY